MSFTNGTNGAGGGAAAADDKPKAKRVRMTGLERAPVRFDDAGNPIDPIPAEVNRSLNQAKLDLLANLGNVYRSVLHQATATTVEFVCAECGQNNEMELPVGNLSACKTVLEHVEKLMELFKTKGGLGIADLQRIQEDLSDQELQTLILNLKASSRRQQ